MNWQRILHRVLRVILAAAVLYVIVVFLERAREPKRPQPVVLPLSPDYYVAPPKSYVRDLGDARALVGKPLWVRDGYRWPCGKGTLGPIEKVIPTRAFQKGRDVWLDLGRCSLPISYADSFFVDEIFLIQDPHEIYKGWTAETWKKIEERRIEPGMTETQITFALGYGELVRDLSKSGDAQRVVEYTAGDRHLRVIYAYGFAKQVGPLP
ncbi:MAG: hypothetical protein HY238_11525 [Acidobacteria bacterium]|nr:hypothetical protein [Acidobacteriota bacterium]